MTTDRLFAEFERLSEAPGALQRMRAFILDLALRGQLVEQCDTDEPVEALLARIDLAKPSEQRRIHSACVDEPELAPIPPTWAWVRLGAIADIVMGQSPPGHTYNTEGRGVPLINGPVEFTAGPFGTTVVNQYTTAPSKTCEVGDLLLCVRGSTTGRTNIAGVRACLGRGVAAIRPLECGAYVRLFIWHQREVIIEMGRGIAFPSISRNQIVGLRVPLPPLAEQERIVAKVDELMALCDQLEIAQAERERRRDVTRAAILSHLTATDGTHQSFVDHARIYLNHGERLVTTAEHVTHVRKTIRDLAIRGRLVHSETTARGSTLHGTQEHDAVFDAGWPTVSIRDVAECRLGKMLDKAKNRGVPRRYLRNVNVRWFDFDLADIKEMLFEDEELDEFALRVGDVLICEGGEPGRAAVWDGREDAIYFQKALHRVRLSSAVDPDFLVLALRVSAEDGSLAQLFTGATFHHLTGAALAKYLFPLPSLPEQRRIVSKVGDLMAVCDQLEESLIAVQTDRAKLLEAVLHEALVEGEMDPERAFAAAH